MSLRKIAGLLAAFGLTLGLIGGGVGAAFHDGVAATEQIDVGSFGCEISSTSPNAQVSLDKHSVTYTAPKILSSAAGNAPFTFTVKNIGDIIVKATVTNPAPQGPFSYMTYALPPTWTIAAGADSSVSTGIKWTELGQAQAGNTYYFTWNVSCDENPNVQPLQ
jgi:hypothetical protein